MYNVLLDRLYAVSISDLGRWISPGAIAVIRGYLYSRYHGISDLFIYGPDARGFVVRDWADLARLAYAAGYRDVVLLDDPAVIDYARLARAGIKSGKPYAYKIRSVAYTAVKLTLPIYNNAHPMNLT